MLVLDTFFRDGAFVPQKPIEGFREGELVKITVNEEFTEEEKQRRRKLLKEARRLVEESEDEILPDDFPTRLKFRTPAELAL